jgi:hypothetical protein
MCKKRREDTQSLEPARLCDADKNQLRLPAKVVERERKGPAPFAFMTSSALSLPILHNVIPDAVYVPKFGSQLDFEAGSSMGFEPERYGRELS